MNKQEYLQRLWQSEKEWNYNLEVAYVFRNLVQNTNPILRSMKRTADMILEADDCKKRIGVEREMEIETEMEVEDEVQTYSLSEAVNDANKILKYGVNGSNTRAYYYVESRKQHDETNPHLFLTLFRYCLLNDTPSVMENVDYKTTLHFIESGCNAIKHY